MSSTRLKAKKCWVVWFLVTCLYLRTTLGQTVQSCPPRGEITPCSCSVKKLGLDIVCEFTDFLHINKAMSVLKGRSNTVIYYLKLRHNNLPKLQGFVFLGLDIHHLTVHNSSLAVVEESSLSSIGKGLTQLDISQNSLSLVPSSALKTLHHLLILNLNHNKINAIHAHAFEGLDTLEILTLYENKISIIDADAFKGVDNRKLKRLNLGGNQLTSVPTAALSTLEMLKKLEMQENRISAIQKGDFAGMKSLDSLGLAHNKLREVPAGVFSHLTQLNSLELEGNMITHVDPDAFMGLEENLQYLRLGDNNLHAVPSDALRRLHRLRHLDLRVNNITVLPEDAFFGYGDSITFLNLQKNLCLPSPFAKPTEYLEASQRALGYSLTSNFHIHMGENPRRLWLAFYLLSIKTLPPMLFENLNSLETLNLQNNKMIHVPEEVMESVVDTLKIIDITDNPLVCDCELRWYSGWLKNLRDKDDEMMSKKRTVCTMVNEHREYSVQNIPLDRMGCMANAKQTTSSNVAVAKKIFGFQVIISMGFVILL